jgi:hypothetical protein
MLLYSQRTASSRPPHCEGATRPSRTKATLQAFFSQFVSLGYFSSTFYSHKIHITMVPCTSPPYRMCRTPPPLSLVPCISSSPITPPAGVAGFADAAKAASPNSSWNHGRRWCNEQDLMRGSPDAAMSVRWWCCTRRAPMLLGKRVVPQARLNIIGGVARVR